MKMQRPKHLLKKKIIRKEILSSSLTRTLFTKHLQHNFIQDVMNQELSLCKEKKKDLITDLESSANQYTLVQSMITRQDELLKRLFAQTLYLSFLKTIKLFHSIFDGVYGSREENALEIELDLLESQKDTIQVKTMFSSQGSCIHLIFDK